jgi:hypothetical protein
VGARDIRRTEHQLSTQEEISFSLKDIDEQLSYRYVSFPHFFAPLLDVLQCFDGGLSELWVAFWLISIDLVYFCS